MAGASDPAFDTLALHAGAATMDESHLVQVPRVRCVEVLVHHRRDVARREGVQVDLVLDGHHDGRVGAVGGVGAAGLGVAGPVRHGFTYSARTVVFRPPRTEKSPTTVMRRGAQAATRSSRIRLVTAS